MNSYTLKATSFLNVYLLGFLISLLISSCKDDRAYKAPRVAGFYEVESLDADIAVDLNNNGITSRNLFEQISYYNFSSPQSYMEIRPTKYNDTHAQYIYIPFPHPHLTFEYTNSPNGSVTYGRNFINGIGYRYDYNHKQNIIHIDRTNVKEEEFWGKLMDIEALENSKLKVILSKNYYDFATARWVRLTLTGIYTRVEN